MKKTITTLLLLFVLSLWLEAKNKDQPIVITFDGNKLIGTSELEELVTAEKPSRFAFWKEKKSTINALLIPKLDELLTLYYQKEGFYDVNVTHDPIDEAGIHFHIQENRYIKIATITIQSDVEIKEAVKLKKGKRFRAADFSDTKSEIRKLLLNQGRCLYKLDTKAYVDLEKYRADIVITLDKGDYCHFGEVTASSDESSIDDDVIFSRLHFKKGDRFSLEKIKESYESLYALEAFDNLHMVYQAKYSDIIPVDVRFKELKHQQHSRVGVGYATDLKFQAKYHWEYRNFYGGARKLAFDLLYSDKQKWIENNFFNPALLEIGDYHLDFQNSVGYQEEQNIHNFDEKVAYDRFYLHHTESNWLHGMGFGIENREISDDRAFFLIYPFIKIIYDRRDSKVNPMEGIYFSHEMEYGLPYSPDSTTYLKYTDELRAIYTLSEITLSAVGRFGVIEVYDNRLPESKKFFAGGAFSNRAYGYQRIGITNSATKPSELGGMSMTNLSMEVNFPLYKSLHFGVFSDNTMISGSEKVWEFSEEIVRSAGFGFRYMTPVGPFKLDFGFNIADYSENAVHFQIGQSF
ncbi:MAG: BamA/TamA family outer membrane protein [Campylobacterales bacterium]|nr:BamA/TamA family outer membrane protein [Campylobacterales bacterium]